MDRQKFIEVVQSSKILFDEEKQSLIDSLDILPESASITIYAMMEGYNSQDQAKKEEVGRQLDQFLTEYKTEIESIQGLSEEKKTEYLHKGDTILKALRKLVDMI